MNIVRIRGWAWTLLWAFIANCLFLLAMIIARLLWPVSEEQGWRSIAILPSMWFAVTGSLYLATGCYRRNLSSYMESISESTNSEDRSRIPPCTKLWFYCSSFLSRLSGNQKRSLFRWMRVIGYAVSAALSIYAFFSGLDVYFLGMGIMLLSLIYQWVLPIKSPIGKATIWMVLICLILSLFSYISHITDRYFVRVESVNKSLIKKNIKGNPYLNLVDSVDYESGYLVWRNISDIELAQEWRKRSRIPLSDTTKYGMTVRETLIRYLTSLGQHKDSVGMAQLTPEDIRAVEKGEWNAELSKRLPFYRYVWTRLIGLDHYFAHPGNIENSFVRTIDDITKAKQSLSWSPSISEFSQCVSLKPLLPSGFIAFLLAVGYPIAIALMVGILLFTKAATIRGCSAEIWMLYLLLWVSTLFSPGLFSLQGLIPTLIIFILIIQPIFAEQGRALNA